MSQPLTLDELIDKLCQLRETHPAWRTRPVHMLDLEEGKGTFLVTHVETDCFDEDQGPVTSLVSDPTGTTMGAS